jgi:hypothetical protein
MGNGVGVTIAGIGPRFDRAVRGSTAPKTIPEVVVFGTGNSFTKPSSNLA